MDCGYSSFIEGNTKVVMVVSERLLGKLVVHDDTDEVKTSMEIYRISDVKKISYHEFRDVSGDNTHSISLCIGDATTIYLLTKDMEEEGCLFMNDVMDSMVNW